MEEGTKIMASLKSEDLFIKETLKEHGAIATDMLKRDVYLSHVTQDQDSDTVLRFERDIAVLDKIGTHKEIDALLDKARYTPIGLLEKESHELCAEKIENARPYRLYQLSKEGIGMQDYIDEMEPEQQKEMQQKIQIRQLERSRGYGMER